MSRNQGEPPAPINEHLGQRQGQPLGLPQPSWVSPPCRSPHHTPGHWPWLWQVQAELPAQVMRAQLEPFPRLARPGHLGQLLSGESTNSILREMSWHCIMTSVPGQSQGLRGSSSSSAQGKICLVSGTSQTQQP